MQLLLTPTHYVYVAVDKTATAVRRNAVASKDVEAGQYVLAARDGLIVTAEVASVELVTDIGYVNVLTMEGVCATHQTWIGHSTSTKFLSFKRFCSFDARSAVA